MKNNTRIWLALIVFGLLGQLAWTIENMYFNVFVYNTLSGDVDVIASMVALSAITATLTTLLIGSFSDRIGKRKVIICLGYIMWGVSVIAFAFLKPENISTWFPYANAASLGGTLAIAMDCIMTFFGSGANDACFNAWITDTVPSNERSKFEGVIATLPLISMLLVFGLLDGLTQKGEWSVFFLIIGILVSLGGLIGFFIIKDGPIEKTNDSFLKTITYGFQKNVIRDNKCLYLSLLCLLIFSISTQIFMPYMIIYIQMYLGITDYAMILGIVLIVASAVSVLVGSLIDKVGQSVFYIPSIIILGFGLFLMSLSKNPVSVILAGIVMMSGNLIVTTLVNSSIRNYTPADKVGSFQGIRMIFGVMLPMIIGPFIGAAVIKNSGVTYTELGTVKQVPTPAIWIAAAIAALMTIIPYLLLNKTNRKIRSEHYDLLTPYGETLNPGSVLAEYPRPQFVRNSYLNLNGYWDYRVQKDMTISKQYDGRILVPFAIESLLSQVQKTIGKDDVLLYHKTVILPDNFNKGILRLHFGAVDQLCWVYVNNKLVMNHIGGYLPFSIDIQNEILANEFELVVLVKDCTDASYYSRGKQSSTRGGIWYTPFTGIWQTVWMESMNENHIESVQYRIHYDRQEVGIHINGKSEKYHVIIKDDAKTVFDGETGNDAVIHIDNPIDWTPENPHLYHCDIAIENDSISSYFAMRKFSRGKDENGIERMLLNNKPYFHKGVLDQGYYSDGIVTPASYKQIEDDILLLKKMGFNTIRKHIKIEPMMFYYYCDIHGMLLWQDMVSGGGLYDFLAVAGLPFININIKDSHYKFFSRENKVGREDYEREFRETVEHLYNVPSLALWVPFNEGWGQFDALKYESELRKLDDSRLIDHASGWHDQGGGDLYSKHIYFDLIANGFKKDSRVWALTEYGGYARYIKDHSYNKESYGYQIYENEEDLLKAFRELHLVQVVPLIEKGLSATIYTQLSDVEDEDNGLITYDRKHVKFDVSKVREILDQLKF